MRFSAILVAAGSSSRMGTGKSKVLEYIDNKTVIRYTLEAFEKTVSVNSVTVVCRPEDMELLRLESSGLKKPVNFVTGGKTRQQSVLRGIEAMPDCDYCVIHDGARPLITPLLIDRVCSDAILHGASAAAVPSKDTCKIVDAEGFVKQTPERSALMAVQTPQVFQLALYKLALSDAVRAGMDFTDDCQLIENTGRPVHLITGDYRNIKLTTPEDFIIARALLAEKKERTSMRIGQGYDVHRLAEGRKLILCGVEISFEKGLAGHSDADVAAHALSDALLGAAALGDIGKLFPDTDTAYKGADSMKLLEEVCRRVRACGYEIGNVDITIVAQQPKLAPYIGDMRKGIAAACHIEAGQVSVKATTEEGLGVSGQGQGIAAHAVCLLTTMN